MSSTPQTTGTSWSKWLAIIIAVLAIGFFIGRSTAPDAKGQKSTKGSVKSTTWTCSMHPAIRQPEMGKCPLCGMDLIPAADGDDNELGPRTMTMTEASMKLAEVRTAAVERRFVDVEIPMVGKVDYDERRVKTISAWVPGRLDRLFVDYTGIPVKKGDHLVEMYSPELYAAQEELLQAIKAVESLRDSSSDTVRRSTAKTVGAVREKLRLLGLGSEQVKLIEKRGTPSATLQINSTASGIVIHKNATEGMYVTTGTPIYTVADLSMVWVILDAYESDIAWLRYGQEVVVKTEAYGDRTFSGWISFIDPVLNSKTRTIRVRVVVDNSNGLLRPNMFAQATVKARVAADDHVVSKNIEGKWVSPMHPEVIKDGPGQCDVCGMDLVQAKDLGYTQKGEAKPPLIVPASAVLTTGDRAIVYLWLPDQEKPTFKGVEISLGARAGDYYVVRSGLEEGQKVVTNGNFKIDSALQLMAKPSMMNPDGGGPATTGDANHAGGAATSIDKGTKPTEFLPVKVSPEFVTSLSPVYAEYLSAQKALAGDDLKAAQSALEKLAHANIKVDMSLAKGEAHMRWMEITGSLTKSLEHRVHMGDIAALRKMFLDVSKAVIALEKSFGHAGKSPHQVAFCPMANDNKGAEWLQAGAEVNNPYYGSAMLRCGEIRKTIPGMDASSTKDMKHDHE